MATVNYGDERFQQVTREQNQAIQNIQNTYNNMIAKTQQYYDAQAKAAEDYGNQQKALQQKNTDFTIQKIEQQKERAEQDYTKEQKGAYVDWQKQSNRYGVNAEQMASQGLRNGGYSESSQVSMYNQYQNRVGTARDSYNRAVQDYDNSITEARLTNSAKLAEIAYNALKTKLEINLKGFESGNQLLLNQINALNAEKDRYYSRWQDVLKQINYENELAEQQRQYEEQMAMQRQVNAARYGTTGGGSSRGSYTINGDGVSIDTGSARDIGAALGSGASSVYSNVKIGKKTYKPSNKVVNGSDGYQYMLYTNGGKQYVYRNGTMIEYSGTTSNTKSNTKSNTNGNKKSKSSLGSKLVTGAIGTALSAISPVKSLIIPVTVPKKKK